VTTTLLPVARDEHALDADPVEYMAVVLHRAKGWLAEAQDIDAVREAKAVAVGYEAVIREKELAFDAQLSATELVRRCERRLGELVERSPRGTKVRETAIGPSGKARDEHYAMAGADEEAFDAAIDEARDEGNLSRANVVRKLRGDTGESFESRAHRLVAGALNDLTRLPLSIDSAVEVWDALGAFNPADHSEWARAVARAGEALEALTEKLTTESTIRRIK